MYKTMWEQSQARLENCRKRVEELEREMAARDGRVLWEGKALIAHYAHNQPQTDFHDVDLVFHFWVPGIVIGMEGQLVDVIVKASEKGQIPEKRPEIEKAQESAE